MLLEIQSQPDDVSCGPTCLQAVYDFYGLKLSIDEVRNTIATSLSGGTLAVFMACDALRNNYSATMYVYNLNIFDPSWFTEKLNTEALIDKLKAQIDYKKKDSRIVESSTAYIEFLNLGGELCYKNLTSGLLKKFLTLQVPVITGLSATYIYNTPREYEISETQSVYDDVRGEPCGHFVVLTGYNKKHNQVVVADPHRENPLSKSNYYEVGIGRLINAIMLGVLTYDANLLIITPKR